MKKIYNFLFSVGLLTIGANSLYADWSTPPQKVAEYPLGVTFGDLAINPDNVAATIFLQPYSGKQLVRVKFHNGTEWGPAKIISSTNTTAENPKIGLAADENTVGAVAIWEAHSISGTPHHIEYSFLTDSWSPPTKLSSTGDGNSTQPQLAVGLDGYAVAVWRIGNSPNARIAGAFFDPNTQEWTRTENVPAENIVQVLDIALDVNNNAFIIWLAKFDDDILLQAANLATSDTSWGQVTILSPVDADASLGYISGGSVDTNAVAVWQSTPDEGFQRIDASVFSGGVWTSSTISVPGVNSKNPHVAMNSDGDAVAVWTAASEVYSSVLSNGSWSAVKQVSFPPSPNARTPKVGIDDNGNAAATWVEGDSTDTRIYTSILLAGAMNWGSIIEISKGRDTFFAPNIAISPSDTGAANKEAMVVWSVDPNYDGSAAKMLSSFNDNLDPV